ncbi:hypothetical protein OQA88_1802, partial [Cercophora sp. LCS_1]
MADPLSVAAGVVAHAALFRVNELSLTLDIVSTLLKRLDTVPADRRDMVRLGHFVLIFTQCVLTLSEVESLLKRATGSALNRIRWNLAEKKIGRSVEVLEKHQASIVLILNCSSAPFSESDMEAQTSTTELHAKMDALQRQNDELIARLMRMEAAYNDDAGSIKFLDDDQSSIAQSYAPRDSLLKGFTASIAARSAGSARPLSHSSFELALGSSRVYLRTGSNGMDASISSPVARSNAWTMLSGPSLNAISVVSVFALPVTLRDINAIGSGLTMSSFFSDEA